MDAVMQRLSKADKRNEEVDRVFTDLRKEVRDRAQDFKQYVMLVADGNAENYNVFMRSPASVFLTAIEAYASKMEFSRSENEKKVDLSKIKK